MTTGPAWLTDPKYDGAPLEGDDWFSLDTEIKFDTPVEECDHPIEQVMTNEYGNVQCHSCGLVVGKKPIVLDVYHGGPSPNPIADLADAWASFCQRISEWATSLAGVLQDLFASDEMVWLQTETQRIRLDAELAQLPRNTRRVIDGRKHRIAGRPGNLHWREVAPARYRGAKR